MSSSGAGKREARPAPLPSEVINPSSTSTMGEWGEPEAKGDLGDVSSPRSPTSLRRVALNMDRPTGPPSTKRALSKPLDYFGAGRVGLNKEVKSPPQPIRVHEQPHTHNRMKLSSSASSVTTESTDKAETAGATEATEVTADTSFSDAANDEDPMSPGSSTSARRRALQVERPTSLTAKVSVMKKLETFGAKLEEVVLSEVAPPPAPPLAPAAPLVVTIVPGEDVPQLDERGDLVSPISPTSTRRQALEMERPTSVNTKHALSKRTDSGDRTRSIGRSPASVHEQSSAVVTPQGPAKGRTLTVDIHETEDILSPRSPKSLRRTALEFERPGTLPAYSPGSIKLTKVSELETASSNPVVSPSHPGLENERNSEEKRDASRAAMENPRAPIPDIRDSRSGIELNRLEELPTRLVTRAGLEFDRESAPLAIQQLQGKNLPTGNTNAIAAREPSSGVKRGLSKGFSKGSGAIDPMVRQGSGSKNKVSQDGSETASVSSSQRTNTPERTSTDDAGNNMHVSFADESLLKAEVREKEEGREGAPHSSSRVSRESSVKKSSGIFARVTGSQDASLAMSKEDSKSGISRSNTDAEITEPYSFKSTQRKSSKIGIPAFRLNSKSKLNDDEIQRLARAASQRAQQAEQDGNYRTRSRNREDASSSGLGIHSDDDDIEDEHRQSSKPDIGERGMSEATSGSVEDITASARLEEKLAEVADYIAPPKHRNGHGLQAESSTQARESSRESTKEKHTHQVESTSITKDLEQLVLSSEENGMQTLDAGKQPKSEVSVADVILKEAASKPSAKRVSSEGKHLPSVPGAPLSPLVPSSSASHSVLSVSTQTSEVDTKPSKHPPSVKTLDTKPRERDGSEDPSALIPKRKMISSPYDIWRTSAEVGKILSQYHTDIRFEVQASTYPDRLQAFKVYLKKNDLVYQQLKDSRKEKERDDKESSSSSSGTGLFKHRIPIPFGKGSKSSSKSSSKRSSLSNSTESLPANSGSASGVDRVPAPPELYIEITSADGSCSIYFESRNLLAKYDGAFTDRIVSAVVPAFMTPMQ